MKVKLLCLTETEFLKKIYVGSSLENFSFNNPRKRDERHCNFVTLSSCLVRSLKKKFLKVAYNRLYTSLIKKKL